MAIGEGSPGQPLRGNGTLTSGDEVAGSASAPASPPPPDVIQLWNEVATGIDTNQTVVWRNAVDSLECAHRYLRTSSAQTFIDRYMKTVISILLEQQPTKIGQLERNCVEGSLKYAVMVIAEDLQLKATSEKGDCNVLGVLADIFNRKKTYYKGSKPNWNVSLTGLPEVRTEMIAKFQSLGGFSALARYLPNRLAEGTFPPMELLHLLLSGTFEAIPAEGSANNLPNNRTIEDDAVEICHAIMEYIRNFDEDTLKKGPHDELNSVRYDLQKIFDRVSVTKRRETFSFYSFWRDLTLRLITSQSLPLKLFGWEQVTELIEASAELRPPPRSFMVQGAGCEFVNGEFVFAGQTTEDGYARPGVDISYEMRIPEADPPKEGAGKKLTLFRCTMRSQQKWWFLSEADEEQPGTDKDIDYYQHKSKQHEEMEPPPSGWATCRNAGVDPPPTLRGVGLMVPEGEELNTLEHQLAKWAITNNIIELVLGDSVHREIVARSTPLIRFLAGMCDRNFEISGPAASTAKEENTYCLQTSHLLLAWRTCTGKADAAVSDEVYQLLVSILPSLPARLATPLLEAIQESLKLENEENLFEVAEFCRALALSSTLDTKGGNHSSNTAAPVLSDVVRAEVLKLMWEVLTHPGSSSLKSHDALKTFITNELRVEPKGSEHRQAFLHSCMKTLRDNASVERESVANSTVKEALALRMVKLTQFVLEACPRQQAAAFVNNEGEALALLLFDELVAYLKRHSSASKSQNDITHDHRNALTERLNILRFTYGVSEAALMTAPQLDKLWKLCSQSHDQEAFMVFIADAAQFEEDVAVGVVTGPAVNNSNSVAARRIEQALTAAFPDSVGSYAFERLFCSPDVNWTALGEGAYQSFQKLARSIAISKRNPMAATGPALDALWRICLTAGNDDVASQAMKDLISVCSAVSEKKHQASTPNAWTGEGNGGDVQMDSEDEESFSDRIFDCLIQVKKGLESGDPVAEQSAERCLRILNAAVGHDRGGQWAIPPMPSGNSQTTLPTILKAIPHGMRGQSCYLRIGIMAKRQASPPSQSVSVSGGGGREEASETMISSPPVGHQSTNQPSIVRFSIFVHPLETLLSIKTKVANYCKRPVAYVKPISISGRQEIGRNRSAGPGVAPADGSPMSLSVVPDDYIVSQLGLTNGCDMVFLLSPRNPGHGYGGSNSGTNTTKRAAHIDLDDLFSDTVNGTAGSFFDTLLGVLEVLPWKEREQRRSGDTIDASKLVWDLLSAMPTNAGILNHVRSSANVLPYDDERLRGDDAMVVDTPREGWTALLDINCFHKSVYIMQVVDSFLQPAIEVLSNVPVEKARTLESEMEADSISFRKGFIESGGFDAVIRFFSGEGLEGGRQKKTRTGNAVALRILKSCLFGRGETSSYESDQTMPFGSTDLNKNKLLGSLSDPKSLLMSLADVVVDDEGTPHSTIMDSIQLLRLLCASSSDLVDVFCGLPNSMAERMIVTLLLWEGRGGLSNVNADERIRKNVHDLILQIPALSQRTIPWLVTALGTLSAASDVTGEFFAVLRQLIEGKETPKAENLRPTTSQLQDVATAVCMKLSSCPRPSSDAALMDPSTGVLSGCLKLLRAIIEVGGGSSLQSGTVILLRKLQVSRWSEISTSKKNKSMISMLPLPRTDSLRPDDITLIDLMGAVFDGFLSYPGTSFSVAICCDKESRQLGFDVVAAAARACEAGDGYLALVVKIQSIISGCAPFLRHRWNVNVGVNEGSTRNNKSASKYSGLRNQGCTCYMNSLLQQLFMMPRLRNNLCSATIPSSLRTSGGGSIMKGSVLVGKKISLQWDNGVSYDAMVESFDESTGMHTIRYCPVQVATVGDSADHNGGGDQVQQKANSLMPRDLPDEFVLSEGRPGKETGAFEVVTADERSSAGENSSEGVSPHTSTSEIEESEAEAHSRHLLEEVQRTFIHLDEGSRGRCFDPRALVEASSCLKLEFDVWQQNDASEYAMKLLDRLENSLKRWAPSHFRFLEHTFGLKQTKQKICKECGLQTNREENYMSLDCQIRGKTDIHEALATVCEVELMEGDNKVFCDRCKKKCDTVLRTAISALPDMLILSLKRFDLDYNTFETVKLNSRCAFGQKLNMKQYTLEGVEALEKGGAEDLQDADAMDTGEDGSDVRMTDAVGLDDADYEYNLAGVLVHAGIAQGGHYYSFIKDRSSSEENGPAKWYRFDDEDVTPFDPASIEVECFGGKVKKEAKWANGTVHTQESEQFANALMLFYEKVKPVEPKEEKDEEKDTDAMQVETTTGFDVFESDVRRSNVMHGWQTFLFDSEFQSFLQGLLELCLDSGPATMTISTPESSPSSESEDLWCLSVLQMLLSYLLDVRLHASDRKDLNDMVDKFVLGLRTLPESARKFVHNIARRTRVSSGNWLKTFCADCPEADSRNAAVRLFAEAMNSCISLTPEQDALRKWMLGWKAQLQKLGSGGDNYPIPTELKGEWSVHEGVDQLESAHASSIGIIVSFIATLLEVAPRTWRYNPELCLLIRNCVKENGASLLFQAMATVHIPARLIALLLRDRAPSNLRLSFPGASVPFDVAAAQERTETSLSNHLLPMGNAATVMSNQNVASANVAMPCASDHIHLLEALGCLIGLNGATRAILVEEKETSSRVRSVVVLSEAAAKALSIVYHESKSPSLEGMTQRDVQSYMKKCGLDSSAVPPQKIVNKYSTATDTNGTKQRLLNLDGFLAYYRDSVQTNEAQVRADLHTFGFRPDLSRRPEETRFILSGDRRRSYECAESVALDVSLRLKNNPRTQFSALVESGILCFYIYSVAYNASESLAEYLLASVAYGRDTNRLLSDTLKTLYRAPSGWAGSETLSACRMILKVLAAVPDDLQQERIATMMQSQEKALPHADSGVGLLVVCKELSVTRTSQHFTNDFQYSGALDRYLDVLKDLYMLSEVHRWMSDRRSLWSWMEHIFRDEGGHAHGQSPADFSAGIRREPETTHHQSDSDIPVVQDSEDEDDVDDDSRFNYDGDLPVESEGKVIVEGAGVPEVNGPYLRSGSFDGVSRFTKVYFWKDREEVFSIFRCTVSDNTKRWYISIVPKNVQPGTNADIDFYSAPIVDEIIDYPPEEGWATSRGEGVDPPPRVKWTAMERHPGLVLYEDEDDEEQVEEEDQSNGRIRNVVEGNGSSGEDGRQFNYL